jgi:hypothetical protein
VVYRANHRAGQLGETGSPRQFCYAAQSELVSALGASRMNTAPNPPRSYICHQHNINHSFYNPRNTPITLSNQD